MTKIYIILDCCSGEDYSTDFEADSHRIIKLVEKVVE